MEETKWVRDFVKQLLKYPVQLAPTNAGDPKQPSSSNRKRPQLTVKWQQLGKTDAHEISVDPSVTVGQLRGNLSKLHNGAAINLIVKGKALVDDQQELRDCWEEGQTIYVNIKRSIKLSDAFWQSLEQALRQEEAVTDSMRQSFVEQLKSHHQEWLSK